MKRKAYYDPGAKPYARRVTSEAPAMPSDRISRADRAKLCAQHGVPNTGRAWKRLRKRLGLTAHAHSNESMPAPKAGVMARQADGVLAQRDAAP